MSYIIDTGNLVAIPELRESRSGRPYASIGVMVNSRREVDGVWQNVGSQRYELVVMGKTAESFVRTCVAAEHNIRVTFAGNLFARAFEREDGTKGTALEVMVDHIGAAFAGQVVEVTHNRQARSRGLDAEVAAAYAGGQQAGAAGADVAGEDQGWPEVASPGGQWGSGA